MWYSPEPVVDPPPHTYFFRQEYVPGKELVPALGSVPAAVREEYVRSRAFEPPPVTRDPEVERLSEQVAALLARGSARAVGFTRGTVGAVASGSCASAAGASAAGLIDVS